MKKALQGLIIEAVEALGEKCISCLSWDNGTETSSVIYSCRLGRTRMP